MAFSYIYYILVNIGSDYEYRVLMPSYVQSFALADGVELGPVMFPDYFSERIILVSGLFDVLPAAAVGLSFEIDIIMYRF